MKTKITVIHHSADFDGLFCREIARKFLGNEDVEHIGWDFKDKPLAIPESGQIYVMDLPVDRVFGFDFEKPETLLATIGHVNDMKALNDRLIWIDHHASSIKSHPPEIPGYRIDGVAACRLAWQWFVGFHAHDGNPDLMPSKNQIVYRTVSEPIAVRLAGEYDVWDKRDPAAETFQFGLRSQELSAANWDELLAWPEIKEKALGRPLVPELLQAGRLLQTYQQRIDAGVMERAFMVEFEGLKFLALNAVRFNSLTFLAKDVPATGHDALMGFYFDGAKFNFSLYHARHNAGVDLSLIAKKFGGGGHRGACGFIWRHEVLPWERRDEKTPLDVNGKRPYLFYYEDAAGCWSPAPELIEHVVSTDLMTDDGDTIEIEFKRKDMTPADFAAIPEI